MTSNASPSGETWLFVDIAQEAGLQFIQRSGTEKQEFIVDVKSTGVAVLDFDGDGRRDLFFTSGSTVERMKKGEPGYGCSLWRNLGGLRFEDVTEKAQLTGIGWACGAASADLNGDGRDDLVITCFGPDRVFLNRKDGTFEDVTARAGLTGDGWSSSAAVADLDGDGDLDLYVSGYLKFDIQNPPRHGAGYSCLWRDQIVMCGPRGMTAEPDRVYANRGDGTFEDRSEAWGLRKVSAQFGLGVVIGDFVGDSRPDIFVANDSCPNYLFENKGPRGREATPAGSDPSPAQTVVLEDLVFEEVGFIAGVSYDMDGQEQAGMGIAVADVDGNDKLDFAVTNFAAEANNLYLNQGDGMFFDESELWGLAAAGKAALSWGIHVVDFNHDGELDVFVANGHVYPQADQVPDALGYGQRDHLFVGQPQTAGTRDRFSEQGSRLGFRAKRVSRGSAHVDLDNDGDLDLVVCHLNAPPALYENRLPAGSGLSLQISLEQPGKNRQALGARVFYRLGDRRGVALVHRQSSFQASHDERVHLGLGDGAPEGSYAIVEWPDGKRERFEVPVEGGRVQWRRGSGKPANATGSSLDLPKASGKKDTTPTEPAEKKPPSASPSGRSGSQKHRRR